MPSVAFFVNVDWFFISHRLPIGLELLKRGVAVHILCGDTGRTQELIEKGFNVHSIPLNRKGVNLFDEVQLLLAVKKILKEIKPDIVHSVTIKPVLYGGIISRMLGIRMFVASISGLGYIFTDNQIKARIIRFILIFPYFLALSNSNTRVIFQNTDDRKIIRNIARLDNEYCYLVRGSGVDLDLFRPEQAKQSLPVVLFLARLLSDKGLREFVEAAEMLKNMVAAKFLVVGDVDHGNPNSIDQQTLNAWKLYTNVEFFGHTNDVPRALQSADIVVLPSYREGLPKSLIEAAACGKAVITTDVPGCRDAIEPGVTGLLVPVKDPERLAQAIQYLIGNPEIRKEMGLQGRRLAEEAFDVRMVVKKHMQIYGFEP